MKTGSVEQFEADLAAAKAAGVPFRTETRMDGARFVHYLTQAEIDDAVARASIEAVTIERARIDRQRDAIIAAGVEWNGSQWHADPVFQAQLTGMLTAWQEGLLPVGGLVPVRSKDNTTALLNRAEVTALAGMVLQHVQAAYASAWQAKDQL